MAILALLWLMPRRDQLPGHAYAIPAGDDHPVVEVLNGAGVQGMARTATRMLRRAGFDVVYFGNAGRQVDSTEVVVRRGSDAAARQVAGVLGTARVRSELDTLRRVDVTVFLGPDYRPPAELHP